MKRMHLYAARTGGYNTRDTFIWTYMLNTTIVSTISTTISAMMMHI
jgi:hypothetical protein